MKRSRSLKEAFQLIYLIGETLCMLLASVLILVILARISGREILGEYALVVTWIAIFQAIGIFGLMDTVSREVGRDPVRNQPVVTHGLLMGIAFTVLSAAMMFHFVPLMDYAETTELAIRHAALILFPGTMRAVCRAAFIPMRRVGFTFGISVIENMIWLAGSIVVALTDRGIIDLVHVLLVARTVGAILSIVVLHGRVVRLTTVVQFKIIRALFRPTFIFAAGSVLGMLFLRLDVILISVLAPHSAIAAYAIAAKALEALMIVPMAFCQLNLPSFTRLFHMADRRRLDTQLTSLRLLAAFVVIASAGVLCFAEPIIMLVFGEEYVDTIPTLRVMGLVLLLVTFDLVTTMLCKAGDREQSDLGYAGLNILSNVGLNILLIPAFSHIGAAIAKLGSIFLSSFLRYRFLKLNVVSIPVVKIVGKPLVVMTMASLAAYLALNMGMLVLSICVFSSGAIVVLYMTIRKQHRHD